MRIVILGAGPAGLYLAYLIKRRQPDADVIVVEQNAADATFGFGVVFSDRALEFLHGDDPQTYAAIAPHMESWSDIAVIHRGERVVVDGVGFAAIGRLKLLQLLQKRARSVGVEPIYQRTVKNLDELETSDLVVGADGMNSLVRRTYEKSFGATIRFLNNRFAWFGTAKHFEMLTQTFLETEFGCFNAHHYRYTPDLSTFIVEVDQPTFSRAKFEQMSEAETRVLCERVFSQILDGSKLISNNSIWRQFPVVHNEHWSFRNNVLLGDALHTAHFSIGSGTRLAMEDAIALDRALATHSDVGKALAAYEENRRPVLEKLLSGAHESAVWYEHFAEHMRFAPVKFAMSYITRSGRVDIDRLRKISPRFVEQFERDDSAKPPAG